MHIETIRRIALARHMFELAEGSLRSKNNLHLFSAVNLAQDAVETFLVALADHLQIAFDQNTKFDKYFLLIDEKICPKVLPFKAAMLRLNRLRIDSKHHGLQPARDECERLLASAREFLDEASISILGAPFSTISAIDLLDDGECKRLLESAKLALEGKDYETCLVSCRKVLYVEIERHYDISAYKDGEPDGLLVGFSRAPYYARSARYVAENVREPTEYIVLDHATVDSELLTSGVDPTDFWNVWRLTPDVFRSKADNWYVKREFSKVSTPDVKEVAEYVFNTTIDITLARQTSRNAKRWRLPENFYIDLAMPGLSIYTHADKASEIAATLPPGLLRVHTDYSVEGLGDDGIYWHICHPEGDKFYYGFIHEDDLLGDGKPSD